MSFIEHANLIQMHIEGRLKGFHLSIREYFLLLGVVFMVTGLGMFMFVLFSGIPFEYLVWNSNPLFYLVTGLVFMLCYIGERRYQIWQS